MNTFSIAEHFDRAIEHFTHRLNFDMITVSDIETLAIDVSIEVLGYVLRIVITIGGLHMRQNRTRNVDEI